MNRPPCCSIGMRLKHTPTPNHGVAMVAIKGITGSIARSVWVFHGFISVSPMSAWCNTCSVVYILVCSQKKVPSRRVSM